jgi:hypothetical protein
VETEKGKSKTVAASGKSHAGAAEVGSRSAPLLGKGTVTEGLLLDQYGSNLRAAAKHFSFPSTQPCGPEAQQVVPVEVELGRVGLEGSSISTVTDPLSSWSVDSPEPLGPPAKVARREVASDGTAGQEAMLEVGMEEGDEGAGQGGVKDLLRETREATPVARGPRSAAIPYARRTASKPATTVRKSARHGKGATTSTIMERAQQLAADKNLESGANKDVDKGTDFAILDILSDSHLTSVVKDSCIVFSPTVGSPGEALTMVRAKERVQAALAATARRLRLEAEARKMAESCLATEERERQGTLDGREPDPGTGSPLGERGPERVTFEGEEGDRVRGTHPTARAEPGFGGAEVCTTQAPKRRRKKPSLTVRKGSSKRRGTK